LPKSNIDNMAAQASKTKDVSTVGEPLLDDNPDRYCMFPIKYPVSPKGTMEAAGHVDSIYTLQLPCCYTNSNSNQLLQ
jgi:hypothetical protein